MTTDFVDRHSIVRTVWGCSDAVLLVFAGSAAEFALNRAVDWLFFTNRIPADPLGRFFSTVRYAQEIVFADEATALRTFDQINAAHAAVERRRGGSIPPWAYRDVLYMLIDYTERAHELLRRPLTWAEKQELYDAFRRVGSGLRVTELPANYAEWRVDRLLHMERDLAYTRHTALLFDSYRRHLGVWRYQLLLQLQAAMAPERVCRLLHLESYLPISTAVRVYGLLGAGDLRSLVHWLLLPAEHLEAVRRLDYAAVREA